jgi:phenylacetate-CoA ligase
VNAWAVKRWIYPLHERLIGRQTLGFLDELERSQWCSAEKLTALQTDKLRSLLTHAARHCPFYRRRFAEAAIEPESARISDLGKLPLLTKADIRRAGPALTWPEVPGGLHRYTTGGSTGEPLVFYFDRRRQAYDQAARIRTHRWFGADLGHPEVLLWGSPIEQTRQNRFRRLRDRITNQLLLNAFAMSAADMDQYLDRIERYNPVSLFGYPSSLALLVTRAEKTGRRVNLPRLRAVFVTGEALSPADRRLLENYFGAPVADCYGSREGGFIAHQCPQGRMHVTDENIVLEILDTNGRRVAPGEVGQVVITHLDTFAMPFIRYVTGDLAQRAASTDPCPCGRGLSTIQSLTGRKTDFLVSRDGTVRHALSAIYVLREHPEIEQYRIVQLADYSIEVQIVRRGRLDGALRDTVRGELSRALGPHLRIAINDTDTIDPLPSGKHQPIVSHVDLAGAID